MDRKDLQDGRVLKETQVGLVQPVRQDNPVPQVLEDSQVSGMLCTPFTKSLTCNMFNHIHNFACIVRNIIQLE